MKYLLIPLITVISLFVFTLILFLIVKRKTKQFLKEYFNSNTLKEALEKTEIEAEETPKSLSSMDTIYLEKLKKDFPNLNINELKSEGEKVIINVLKAIENKNEEAFISSGKINSFIKSKINDENNIYKNIKIHKTVLNKYEKNASVATIYLASAVECTLNNKKHQTRFQLEYIYIIDSGKIGSVKALGLNCPNCGAPIKSLGNKKCEYCSSGVVDIVKKNWIINNIKEY